MANFFYDGQIRRFLLQFARMFSNFEVEYGYDDAGNVTLMRIPVRYGDAHRQAQAILQENSANNIPCAPLMTFYISDLRFDQDRIQEPYYVDRKYIRQREWNDATQTYENTQGNAFTVERPMPVPHTLTVKLDIWTTNTQMKLQIVEQITTLFNPSLEIQSTDNYLDWTSLSVVTRKDINWTSRSIPNGNDEIDITTFTFEIPIWISPPARVTKGGIVHKVIASMYDSDGKMVDAINQDDLLLGTRVRITPHGYQVLLLGNQLQILPNETPGTDPTNLDPIELQNSRVKWHPVIDEYGVLRDGITQIRIEDEETGLNIIGTVSYDPNDETILNYSIDTDTLPSNTLPPVDAIINPLRGGPGAGLPAATVGQRYLLTNDIGAATGADPLAWGNIKAHANDIIEYDGSQWIVSFNNETNVNTQYVTNITTGVQYRWHQGQWLKSYEGIYEGGKWAIVL